MSAADRASAERQAQGLPPQVTDPATIERVGRIVHAVLRDKTHQPAEADQADDEGELA